VKLSHHQNVPVLVTKAAYTYKVPPISFLSQPSLAIFQTRASSVGYVLVTVKLVGPVTFNGTVNVHVSSLGSYIFQYINCVVTPAGILTDKVSVVAYRNWVLYMD